MTLILAFCWCDKITETKERFILVHGFRDLRPWSVVLGPVARQHIMVESVIEQAIHLMVANKQRERQTDKKTRVIIPPSRTHPQ
jgi:hypothetical protein